MKAIYSMKASGMLLAALLMVPALAIAQSGGTGASGSGSGDQPGGAASSMPGQQMNQPQETVTDQKAVDMTGGQQGLVGKYDVVPVRRGELVDEKGGHLDQIVKNKKGETLGTIEKLLKDTKTGKVEYAVLELEDKFQLPLQWNQFKQEGDHLTLNASKADLRPSASQTLTKDMSPEISHYMDEINKVRSQPKPKDADPSAGGTDRPAAAGPMGEDKAAGSGPGGPRGLPPGGAPGHEGNEPSSKR